MVYPWGMWILSFVVILLSIVVVWSECLFFIVEPVLSIFALFVQLAADDQNYFAIEVCITYRLKQKRLKSPLIIVRIEKGTMLSMALNVLFCPTHTYHFSIQYFSNYYF